MAGLCAQQQQRGSLTSPGSATSRYLAPGRDTAPADSTSASPTSRPSPALPLHATTPLHACCRHTLHPLPRCSHGPLCPDSTTASAEKRRGRRAGSAHRAGRLGRRAMAMTIRAKVWQGVRRGDEGRCPRVAVALGLLVRPRRTGQFGRGGARGRRVTLFQRRCWFGMSACLSWPVSAATHDTRHHDMPRCVGPVV